MKLSRNVTLSGGVKPETFFGGGTVLLKFGKAKNV